jgi:hypothetical protein
MNKEVSIICEFFGVTFEDLCDAKNATTKYRNARKLMLLYLHTEKSVSTYVLARLIGRDRRNITRRIAEAKNHVKYDKQTADTYERLRNTIREAQ